MIPWHGHAIGVLEVVGGTDDSVRPRRIGARIPEHEIGERLLGVRPYNGAVFAEFGSEEIVVAGNPPTIIQMEDGLHLESPD